MSTVALRTARAMARLAVPDLLCLVAGEVAAKATEANPAKVSTAQI